MRSFINNIPDWVLWWAIAGGVLWAFGHLDIWFMFSVLALFVLPRPKLEDPYAKKPKSKEEE